MLLNNLNFIRPVIDIFRQYFNFEFAGILVCVFFILLILELIYHILAYRYFKNHNCYKGAPDGNLFVYGNSRNNRKPFNAAKALMCLKICKQSYFDYPPPDRLKKILANFPNNPDDYKGYDINFINDIYIFTSKYQLEYVNSKSFNNGFYAVAFKNSDKDLIIAYRGSNDKSDWLFNNYDIISYAIPDQIFAAIDFYRECQIRYNPSNDSNVIITGHSLGGGLAQLVGAFEPDTSVYTFNAIGTYHLLDEPDFYEYIGYVNHSSPVFKKYIEVINGSYNHNNDRAEDVIKNLSRILDPQSPNHSSSWCTDSIYNLVCSSDVVGNVAEHIGEADFIPPVLNAGAFEIKIIKYLRRLVGVRLSILSFLRRNFVYPVTINFLDKNSCLFRKKLAAKQSFYSFFLGRDADTKLMNFVGSFSYILFTLRYPVILIIFTALAMYGVIALKTADLYRALLEFMCSYTGAFLFIAAAGVILAALFLGKITRKLLTSHGLDLIETYLINNNHAALSLFTSQTRSNHFLHSNGAGILKTIGRNVYKNWEPGIKNVGITVLITVISVLIVAGMCYLTRPDNFLLALLCFPTVFCLVAFISLDFA